MSYLSPSKYYQQGDLHCALLSAGKAVKDSPNNTQARILFVELLCVNGEFERADSQLAVLMTLQPELSLNITLWRKLIYAAQCRMDVYQLKAKPDIIDKPTPAIGNALDILVALKDRDEERLSMLIKNIDDENKINKFIVNNNDLNVFRDLDDVTANIFEVMGANGKYFWIDFSQVVEIAFDKPKRILDVLWRRATIVLSNGTEGEVYFPAIYPKKGDTETVLGKKTEWSKKFSLYQGVGLKTWIYGDFELTINDIDSIKNTATYKFN
ncbi:MAG: hypothetical protein KTR20_03600 [Cellvibrionaceae bacterium]|nr:hypothetical protein [Cellvibrionaceae bacterium]